MAAGPPLRGLTSIIDEIVISRSLPRPNAHSVRNQNEHPKRWRPLASRQILTTSYESREAAHVARMSDSDILFAAQA
ncbi:hypothetical protein ACVIJ6_005033 [Bradyrhizobium sp. USDA 4369]